MYAFLKELNKLQEQMRAEIKTNVKTKAEGLSSLQWNLWQFQDNVLYLPNKLVQVSLKMEGWLVILHSVQ